MGWENSGDGLLVSGAISGAQTQAQTFTNGIIATPIYGGTAANDDISISGTSHATKTTSYVLLQPSGGGVAIGASVADSLLHVSNSLTANTATVQQLLTLSANSTGTAAAGFGSRILWELESSTTDDQAAAVLDVQWADATHASRSSRINLQVVVDGNLIRWLHNYKDPTATGRNVFLGLYSGNTTMSPAGGSATLSSYNVGLGAYSLNALTTGFYNLGIGYAALKKCTTGNGNAVLGTGGLENLTEGYLNTAMGDSSMNKTTTGTSNTAIGAQALFTQTTASGNVGIGFQAGYYETGSNKLFIDNATRASEADGRAKALIYGEFNATVASQKLTFNCGYMGFFNTVAVAKPTGVTVDAAGIHAALVTLGLIAA